jgi:hypothetical protein
LADRHAQQIANHESSRTTKLYDRTSDAISLDEVERILIQCGIATTLRGSLDEPGATAARSA